MPSHSQKKPAHESSTSSGSSSSSQSTAGVSNARVQEEMGSTGSSSDTPVLDAVERPNDRTFVMDNAALKTLNPKDLEFNVGSAVGQSIQVFGSRNKQDGVSLTELEKLWIAADTMYRKGLSGPQVLSNLHQLFFGTMSPGGDYVWAVMQEGDAIRLRFNADAELSSDPGPVADLVIGKPSVYQGNDTNYRQHLVDCAAQRGFEDSQGHRIPVTDTFLDQPEVMADLLMQKNPNYARVKKDNPKAFADLLTDFMYEDLIRDYMMKAESDVLDKLGDVGDRSPSEVAEEALELAMEYANPYVGARAHTTIEIQDEAVVQNVMRELGSSVNMNSDTGETSSVTKAKKNA